VLNRLELVDADEPLEVTIRDPKDEPIVRAAVAGECAFIVSGDLDLLSARNIEGVDIISVSEFLEMIG
jgi:predicted nucleic acid-binding protein